MVQEPFAFKTIGDYGMKIEEHKLLELRDKALKAQRAVQTFTSYENLLLHRKGKTNKTHRIDLGTGEIVERAA